MSYIIVFWDKSKLQVADDVAEKLKTAIDGQQIKNFILGQGLYSVSGVEKIIPKSEAYDIFTSEWERLKKMEDVKASTGLVVKNEGLVV